MSKSNERLLLAQHTFEFMKSETDQREANANGIFSGIQGPVAGMRQAAALLGGKLESDSDGFKITFNDTTTDLHIRKDQIRCGKQT